MQPYLLIAIFAQIRNIISSIANTADLSNIFIIHISIILNYNRMHFQNKFTNNPFPSSNVNQQNKMSNINLNQMNDLYEDEYEEDQSEPLIEQIDENYEPTASEIKEYAIETLGMSFPEDDNLLYLAREGLKAPLPPNWVPYQGRDGEVYYKHRITQEKTYDHPTDREYKKKYDQQKQKMARSNLKSIGLKNAAAINMVGGISNLSNNSSLLGKAIVQQLDSVPSVKLDPKLQESYQRQLQEIQINLKKDFKQFQQEEQQKHAKKMKKYKQEYQNAISSILTHDRKNHNIDQQSKSQKQKLKTQIYQEFQQKLQRELSEYENDLHVKNQEYSNLYFQDNQLKVQKYKYQKQQLISQKQQKYDELFKRHLSEKQNILKQTNQKLLSFKLKLQNESNHQIAEATSVALNQQIVRIKLNYENLLREKQLELLNQFNQTKRVLGYDMSSHLSQIAFKKSRIKQLSNSKIESYKKKQIGVITNHLDKEYQDIFTKIKMNFSQKCSDIKSKITKQEQEKTQKSKQNIDKEISDELNRRVKQIYNDSSIRISQFQTNMNKKIASIQNAFISSMKDKDTELDSQITSRIRLNQKQSILQNKQQLLQSMRRQLQLQRCSFQSLQIKRQILTLKSQKQIDDYLMKVSRDFNVDYKSQIYVRTEQKLRVIKTKYKQDKQILSSLMIRLQSNQPKFSKSADQQHSSNLQILKQYNQDVRTLRQNDEKIQKLQMILRKLEINDQHSLQELQNHPELFQYQQIQLRHNLRQLTDDRIHVHQIGYQTTFTSPIYNNYTPQNIEDTLKDHSKFLSTVKHDLNRKLYQIRNHSFYNY